MPFSNLFKRIEYAKQYRQEHKLYLIQYYKLWEKRYPERRIKWRKEHPEHIAYFNARRRCNDINYHQYKYYGGRGIKFLFTSFQEFFMTLGKRPNKRYSLDRINNNGNYEPGNIR